MINFKKIIRKYNALRIVYKIFYTSCSIGKALVVSWPFFLLENPKRIKFISQWFISFRPGATPFKDKLPLMPFEAIEWLKVFLKKDMNVFEYGSGGSTLFIAPRVKKMVSVDHSPEWYSYIFELLKKNNITNCEYLLKEPVFDNDNLSDLDESQSCISGDEKYKGHNFKDYVQAIDNFPDGFFDLVTIDGRARLSCISHATRKIRAGGFLLLDDSERDRYFGDTKLFKKWTRKDFSGAKPYVRKFSCKTTIWQKRIS